MAGKGEVVVNAQAGLKRGCDESSLRPVDREAGHGACRMLATPADQEGNKQKAREVFCK